MPYIKTADRVALDTGLRAPDTAGELNYAVSSLVDEYINRIGGISYAAINEVVGVLECAKLEAYRRLAADYEDEKARINGEVYTCLESNE